MNSINTNYGASIALQNLNSTNSQLQTTQNRISTGLKVATAADNGAVWSIAQSEKTQVAGLSAATDSLNNATSVLNTTISVGSQVTDLLNQMQTAAVAAKDTSIDTTTRAKYSAQFKSLAAAVDNAVNSATFNGKNLINGTASSGLSAIGDATGATTLTSASNKLTTGSGGLGLSAADKNGAWTASQAATAVTDVGNAIKKVTTAMAQYGVDSQSMSNQLTTVSNLSDALNSGIGNLIDADVAKESANLTALQTKQQLGIQALSIANSSSSSLLSLFRG